MPGPLISRFSGYRTAAGEGDCGYDAIFEGPDAGIYRLVKLRFIADMKFPRKRSASADEDADLHVQKQKLTRSPDERCPRLRSRLVVRHPLIVEAATMQVQSLGMFELAPTQDLLSQSSDGSIIDIWSPRPSLDPSVPLSGSPSPSPVSGRAPTSRTGTAPHTQTSPLPSQPSRRIRSPRTPDGEVPPWFAEAFASDGYDSEALDLIRHLSPSTLSTPALAPEGGEAPNPARQQPVVDV
ncbi:hypothetical protein PR002_g17605 [Phytophthora rubi]|uniref:Uncharacterized protein n=2 Tax=Phytophthora rubi TaxID=129364 RepID=A0A6A3KAF6_9STRA|nr:hypothetical protein PR002_g17605 [Phytophthora rubi]